MSSESAKPAGGKRPNATLPSRRPSTLVLTVGIVLALLAALTLAASLWTEALWFDQVGYLTVWRTQLLTQVGLFVVAGVVTAGAVAASMIIAFRSRPVYAALAIDTSTLEHYRSVFEPVRRWVVAGIAVFLGLLVAMPAAQQWSTFVLWLNASNFGKKDAQFGLDLSFFIFHLPWWQFVVSVLSAVVMLAAVAGVAVHYIYGGLRLQGEGSKISPPARLHLFGLAAMFLLLRAVEYWLGRFELTTHQTRIMTGLGYTDANAVLPAQGVLAAVALVVSVLFVVAIFFPPGRVLPAYGVALLIVCSVVVGGLYPAAIQNFKVRPNEQPLEATYVQRAIAATREAYGLGDVQNSSYQAQPSDPTAVRNQVASTPGVRLIDPAVVSDTFRQIEQKKPYYRFVDRLDIDRYTVENASQDTVVAVRELNLDGVPSDKRNWYNDHLVYTHGFGLVGAGVTNRTSEGLPEFYASKASDANQVTGQLGTYEPRVYFGENLPEYSLVGAPSGSTPREIGFADAGESGKDTVERYSTYVGKGGVAVNSLARKLAFALKYQEQNILLSDAVVDSSRIMFVRDPKERIAKVAPFLTLDGNAYPTVVDGRLLWIVDGYTTSDRYPYSDLQQVGDTTSDSVTENSSVVEKLKGDRVNYIRNSVKATVDAYDGTVNLYAWDSNDPVLKTWTHVFPGLVKPMSQMSGSLMSHVRYPEDLFKMQRSVLGRYHVTDPAAFFGGGDYWKVPLDPTAGSGRLTQPAYYQSLKVPGADQTQYSLTSSYIPLNSGTGTQNRDVLTGYLVADSNAGNQAGQRREGYGTLRLLSMPDGSQGPGQIFNQFSTNSQISELVTYLKQNNASTVQYGNLLTIPLTGGVFYVQPLYARASGSGGYPILEQVLVSYNGSIGNGKTLDEAMRVMFTNAQNKQSGQSDSGTITAKPSASPSVAPSGSPSASQSATPSVTSTGGSSSVDAAKLQQAIADANKAMADADAALKASDFAAYGAAQDRLKKALQTITELTK